jgi:hypothetical protein
MLQRYTETIDEITSFNRHIEADYVVIMKKDILKGAICAPF